MAAHVSGVLMPTKLTGRDDVCTGDTDRTEDMAMTIAHKTQQGCILVAPP